MFLDTRHAATGGLITHPDTRSAPLAALRRALDLIWIWSERARSRDTLARMDDRVLNDIGLSRADVAFEIDKPFWRT